MPLSPHQDPCSESPSAVPPFPVLCCARTASSRKEPGAREHPQLRHLAKEAIPTRAVSIPCSASSTGCHPRHSPRKSIDVTRHLSKGHGWPLTVTQQCPQSPGGTPWAGTRPAAPPAPREKESLGSSQGIPACPPQVTSLRCICSTSSKRALIRGLGGFPSHGEKRHT